MLIYETIHEVNINRAKQENKITYFNKQVASHKKPNYHWQAVLCLRMRRAVSQRQRSFLSVILYIAMP